MTDRLVCSTVNQNQDDFSIEMVDFFQYAGQGVIDVLKMDIEGGERELLEDPRFGGLHIRYLAMEWHEDAGSGRDWRRRRLSGMGYRVGIRRDRGPHGTLTATREASIELRADGPIARRPHLLEF